MSLINTEKLTTILRSITSAIKGLDIFSGVQVGQDVFAADGNTDILPLIAGNNMSISATQNGITFAAGSNIQDVTEYEYSQLTTAEKMDPSKYYCITDLNEEGWVVTDIMQATSGTTSLVFDWQQTGHGGVSCRSIHPTSIIKIQAESESSKTKSQNENHNTVTPIYARVDWQDEGTAQIKFDDPGSDPVDFCLWIKNM